MAKTPVKDAGRMTPPRLIQRKSHLVCDEDLEDW
jgi:hypothetical protein